MYFLCQNRHTGEIVIAYGKDGSDVKHKFEVYMPDPYLIGGSIRKDIVHKLDYPVYFMEDNNNA